MHRDQRLLSSWLPNELYAALEAAAVAEGRSVAGQARLLLAQGLGIPIESIRMPRRRPPAAVPAQEPAGVAP